MQCLQLTRGDPPAATLKWYFNKTITLPEKGTTWTINFVLSDNTRKYHKLYAVFNTDEIQVLRGSYYASMGGQQISNSVDLYTHNEGWVNSNYRTITFDTPPTGTLLSWLKANATPQ